MTKAVIVSACRTAGGKFGGQFSKLTATDLGAAALKEAVARSGAPAEAIEEVIMGNVLQAGQGDEQQQGAEQ